MKTDSAPHASILLVDDNTHGLVARGMILRELGHTVETAQSGEEAWDLFLRTPFDLVVTDYRMHRMDGLELIRLIRASGSPARVILLSGFVGCLGMTDAATGADEVIAKSNKEVPELLRAVRKLLQHPPRRKPGATVRKATIYKTGSIG
jgi:two-component system, chemotaxis family, sensor kinase CheA